MVLSKLMMAVLAAAIIGCGAVDDAEETIRNANIDKPDELTGFEGTAEEASFDQVSQDSALVSQNIQHSADEVSSSLADGDTSANVAASLALADLAKARDVKRERKCEKPADDVVVSINRGMEHTVKREGPRRTHERYFKFSSELTRTWSNDNNDMACDEEGKHVDLKNADFNTNVKLVADFSRSKTQWMKVTTPRGERSRQHAFESNGTRTVSWASATEDADAGTITLERTVTLDVSRKFELAKAGDVKFGFEQTITTKEDAPLVQQIVRDSETMKPIKRTIKSGTVIATRKDKGYIEKTYTDVVYETANACMPVSGSIAGAMYKDGEEEAVRSFSIAFNGETAEITFANGDTEEYLPEGCELEDIEENDEAAESADEESEGGEEE